MQPINQFSIFDLGSKFRAVALLSDEATLSESVGPLFGLQTALTALSRGNPILLDYSMGGIRDCLEAVKSVISSEYHGPDGKLDLSKDWSAKFSPWTLGGLKSNLVRLEHLLAAEFEKTATYLVAKTTSFDTSTLIERATETLPPAAREQLSEMAIFDFTEAGKCLGFGLHTAAGFHAARATEAVMHSYCEMFLGTDPKHHRTWGQMLKALTDSKKEPKPDKSTLALLEQIKNVDRNDLMHPRKTLDLTETIRLFHLATATIIAMAMELSNKSGAAKQGALFDATGLLALAKPEDEDKEKSGEAA